VEIFGVGSPELVLILVIMLLIFGPGKLPQMGAKLGDAVRQMRRATRDFSQEMDAARQAIEGPVSEITPLGVPACGVKQPLQDVTQPLQEIGTTATTLVQAVQAARNPGRAIRESVFKEMNRTDELEERQTDAAAAQGEPLESAF